MTHLKSATLVSIAIAACGFACEPPSTPGESEKATFRFGGIDCLFGCEIRPLARGAEEQIVIDTTGVFARNARIELAQGSSLALTDAEASVDLGDETSVTVVANEVGVQTLYILSADGSVIDSIRLEVREAASFRVTTGSDASDVLEAEAALAVGDTLLLRSTVLDAAGEELQATELASWSHDSEGVAELRSASGTEGLVGNWMQVIGRSQGSDRITIDAENGVTRQLTIDVQR